MNKFLSTLHRWLGFPLGILFVITFATGSISSVDELLKKANLATENSHYLYQPTTLADNAQALTIITEGKKDIRSIVLPTSDTPYYRVEGRGESWTYAIDQPENAAHVKSGDNSFFNTNLQLHRNYLLGRDGLWGVEGKHYAAWVGLIATLLSLLGLWLWWPLRKGFKAKDIVLNGLKRKNFYLNHMTSGIVVFVVIVMLTLTGASITYRAFTEQLLGVQRDSSADKQLVKIENNWLAWLETAYAQMPEDAQLQQIRYPRQPRQNTEKQKVSSDNNARQQSMVKEQTAQKDNEPSLLLDFRFYDSGDWLGLASSSVNIDIQRSVLVSTNLFSNLSLGDKIFSTLKPLHTGRQLPALYVGLLLLLSILGTVMVFSGVVSFIIKKRKRMKVTQGMNVGPLTES